MTVIIRSKITGNLVDSYEGSEEGARMFEAHMREKYSPKEINIVKI